MSTLSKHLLQGLSLWYGTGESVEYHSCMLLAERVVYAGKNINHQLVRDQLTLVDKLLGSLTQFGIVLNLITEHVACGDMSQSVLLDHLVALRTLAGTRSSEYNNVLHYMFIFSFVSVHKYP